MEDLSLRIPLHLKGAVYCTWLERFMDYIGGPIPFGVTNREILIKFAEAKAFDVDRRRFEKPYANRFTRLLARQGRICAQTVLDTGADAESVLRSLQYFEGDIRILYHVLYQDVGEFFARRVVARLVEQLKAKPPPYAVENPFANPEFSQWYNQTSSQKITAIDAATRIRIRADLYTGLQEGTSVQHLARDLRASYMFSRIRANRIARTEIIAASNSATHFGLSTHTNAKALEREWIATLDARTRSTHQYGAGAGGQKRKWGKPYNVGHSELMFPGDTALGASAAEVVNCRCTEGFKRIAGLVRPPKPKPISITPRIPKPIPKPVETPIGGRPSTWSDVEKGLRADLKDAGKQFDVSRSATQEAEKNLQRIKADLKGLDSQDPQRKVLLAERRQWTKEMKALKADQNALSEKMRNILPKYFNPSGVKGKFKLINTLGEPHGKDIKAVEDWVNNMVGDDLKFSTHDITIRPQEALRTRSGFTGNNTEWRSDIWMESKSKGEDKIGRASCRERV